MDPYVSIQMLFKERMAADSDGQTLQAVVICEGDLRDPEFPSKFRHLVGRLNKLLVEKPKSRKLKVNKVGNFVLIVKSTTAIDIQILCITIINQSIITSRWSHGTVSA